MKPLAVFFTVLVAAAGLRAQTTGISGTVFDAETGAPIAGATVCCYVANAPTDSQGNYLIDDLAPGRYRVRAIRAGYETGYYPESVEVVHGRVTERVNFALVRTGAQSGCISGWVTDAETRQPVIGATVCTGSGSGQTDETGYYVIDSLEPRLYQVRAMATGYLDAVYPESVQVLAGQMTGDIDFILQPVAPDPGAIWGRVTCSVGGTTLVGAVVRASSDHLTRTVTQCSTGYRLCDLPPGAYWVSATRTGYEPGHYPESVLVASGQIADDIDFPLVPAGSQTGGFSGFVTNSQTREPVMGALVVAEGPSRGQASTCQRGGYCIRELLPGVYVARAAACGFEPSPLETIEVTAGHITPDVNFSIEPLAGGTGAITGRVRDSLTGIGINDAYLLAWGGSGQGSAGSESCGGYIIRELRAGPYLVRACKPGYYHKLFADTVCVGAGETARDVNFLLAPVQGQDCGISGFVFDGGSQSGVSGASVTAIGPGGSRQTASGPCGDYLVDGLEPGEYSIEVQALGYTPGVYPDPVTVELGVVAAFVSPALYPLTVVAEPRPEPMPGSARLRVEPNPLRGRAQVRFAVAQTGAATLRVLDRSGREVRLLRQGVLNQGIHTVGWDGTDNAGKPVAEGVYFVRLETRAGSDSRQLVLLGR
jgi:hypothetical protein